MKVPLIFEYEGEDGFRERETNILYELVAQKNIILATGGGVILSKVNRRLLKKNGIIIYLKSDYKDLGKRMENDKTRPLLQDKDIELTLKNLFSERDSLYSSISDFEVNTKNKRAHQVENEIRALLENENN